MTRYINERDSLAGILRNFDVRLQREERLVFRGIGGQAPSEVEIDCDDPIVHNSQAELWFDPCAEPPPGGGGGITVEREVEIATEDPIPTNPDAELWYDPDAPTTDFTASEVEVSTSDPITANPAAELWFDPDAAADPFQSINEVWIGDVAPTDTNVELWFSPSATLP